MQAVSETYLQVIDKALLYIDLENTGIIDVTLSREMTLQVTSRKMALYNTENMGCDLSAMSKSLLWQGKLEIMDNWSAESIEVGYR